MAYICYVEATTFLLMLSNDSGADPTQNLSGVKTGTLKHIFDLETVEE